MKQRGKYFRKDTLLAPIVKGYLCSLCFNVGWFLSLFSFALYQLPSQFQR